MQKSEVLRLKQFALLAALTLQTIRLCVLPVGASDALNTTKGRQIMRHAKAAEMRNFMLDEVRPCDNFYKHACGNWAKINPAITDGKTGIFNVLLKAYSRKALRLLSTPKSTDDSAMERRVKYFFESCQNRSQIQRFQKARLLAVLEEFGGMPAVKGSAWREDKFDWLEVVANILRRYGKKIIIDVEIAADLMNNEVNRLYIGQLDEVITTQALEYYANLRIERQLELQRVFGLSMNTAAKTASDIVDFEFRLAAGISEPHDGLGMEDKTRLRLLDEMSETYKPTLNLTRFVSTWLGYEYRLPVYEYVESYFWNLRKVIQKTPKRVLANYIMWQLAQEFYIKVEQTDEQHANTCVDMTLRYFIKYVDRLIYRSFSEHSERTRADIDQMWLLLKQAFSQTLNANATDWISEETRKKALEKLAAMRIEVNSYEQEDFEEEFGDLVISTEDYFQNIENILTHRGAIFRQRISAPPTLDFDVAMHFSPSYASEFNKVLIPVSFLQPRYLWDDVYPAAIKFSTVGYIMAHEMAHGFDDNIRKYDAKGNLNNWWDRNSTEAFTARKDCLRQQFSEYRYYGRRLPKSNAQGENIADNVGVRIAHAAYREWLQLNLDSAGDESLPLLEANGEHLFFLGLAQLWCTDINYKWRNVMTTADVHAPEEVRVQAMLANFDEFANVYQCELGSNMHPRRKCVIY